MPGRDREKRRVAAMLAATLGELRDAIETLRNLPGTAEKKAEEVAEPDTEAKAATDEAATDEAGADEEGT